MRTLVRLRVAVVAAVVATAFGVMLLLAACWSRPQWQERPERPEQSGRQDAPTGGNVGAQ